VKPLLDRCRIPAQVDRGNQVLDGVGERRGRGERRQLAGAYVHEEHQREHAEAGDGEPVDDESPGADVDVARTAAAVQDTRQALEDPPPTAAPCHRVEFSH
jgi:hypothetical protein